MEEVKETKRNLKEIRPDIHLAIHVVVGFPSETENDFLKRKAMLAICSFSRIIEHRYSVRPNTISCQLPGKGPKREKIKQLWRLRKEF